MEEIDEKRLISQAMSLIGSRKTPVKAASSRGNIQPINEERKEHGFSEGTRAKLREAQLERRARERAKREAASPAQPKRPRGRPKKEAALKVNLRNDDGEHGED
jgi:hypothetical protein